MKITIYVSLLITLFGLSLTKEASFTQNEASKIYFLTYFQRSMS